MINSIKVSGFRGLDREETICAKTLIVGPNGSGKSSLIHAAALAIRGYVPGEDKRNADLFANASSDTMTVGVNVNGNLIERTWARTKKGVITESVSVNGVVASCRSAEGMIQLAVGKDPIIMDIHEFWGMSDRLKRMAILRLVCDEAAADELLNADEASRKELNDARATRRAAEQSVKDLADQLARFSDKGVVDRTQAEADLEQVRTTLKDLRDAISRGEENDRNRKKLEKLAESLASLEASKKELEAAVKESGKLVKQYEQRMSDITAEGQQIDVSAVPDEFRDVIEECLAELEPIDHPVATSVRGKLQAICRPKEELEALAKTREDLLKEYKESQKARQDAQKDGEKSRKQVGVLQEQIKTAKAAGRELDKIGAGVSDEDRKAVEGMEAREKELYTQIKTAVERETILKEIERAKVAAEKAVAVEDEIKEKIVHVLQKQSETLKAAEDLLISRANRILPVGTLKIEDDGKSLSLLWERDGLALYRSSLSGSERVLFDGAVARALGGDGATVFLDAGECSDETLESVLKHIAHADSGQVVIARWLDVSTPFERHFYEGWTIIEMGKAEAYG